MPHDAEAQRFLKIVEDHCLNKEDTQHDPDEMGLLRFAVTPSAPPKDKIGLSNDDGTDPERNGRTGDLQY